ncbi:MAG TPA: hypothetical protein VFU34_00705 [Gaiellaceae bacterium]|nr:hypothetical protein [Gaiellaceae bacterium]
MRTIAARALVAVFVGALCTGCLSGNDVDAELEAARAYDELPLYWVGDEFEGFELSHVSTGGMAVGFVYGTCEISGDHGCPPPLQIQIFPLCFHLDVATVNDRWQRRELRSAPVGVLDSAPVMFTQRTQIKVYRGQGSTPGLAIRTLQALRSLNDVPPRIGRVGPIPPPAPGVLEGTAPCPD